MIHISKTKKVISLAQSLHEQAHPQPYNSDGDMEIVPFPFDCIEDVSQIKLNLPMDLRTTESKSAVKNTIKKII